MRVLSFQRDYACRHSGACCSAGWIDPRPDGVCRHFDGRCSIQRVSGHDALPHACQQFPRVATLSPLGVSVTLSAFCPTAASLLFDEGPFSIVTLDDNRRYEGLDATNVLPPLLRDGMLMDWESVAAWEELAIATLSAHRHDAGHALRIIEQASEDVCATWTPARGSLGDALTAAFADADISAAEMPESATSAAHARYLASHAFACWPMYDGRGIRGALDHLKTVRAALREERGSLKERIRQTDLKLRHGVGHRT